MKPTSSSELENEHDYSESEGEALEGDQDGVMESNDDVPRWCREEFKAGASGASTRKWKSSLLPRSRLHLQNMVTSLVMSVAKMIYRK